MKAKLKYIFLISFIFLIACPNKYRFKGPPGNYKVALAPVDNTGLMVVDTLMTMQFYMGNLNFLPATKFRKMIKKDTTLSKVVNKIKENSNKTFSDKSDSLLYKVLDKNEIVYLQNSLDHSDFILIPIEFSVLENNRLTECTGRFRLYNMKTGDLVMKESKSFKVRNIKKETAKRFVSDAVIHLIRKDYERLFK